MAASQFDGSLQFWKDGLPMDAGKKFGGTSGDYIYWQFAEGFLRNTTDSPPPADVITQPPGTAQLPVRQRIVVGYW